jgi:hypothetical protein
MPGAGTLRLGLDHDNLSRCMSFAPWSSHDVAGAMEGDDEFREGMARVRAQSLRLQPSVLELVAEVGESCEAP